VRLRAAATLARPAARSAATGRATALLRYGYALAFAVGALVLSQLFLEPLAGAHFVFSMGAVCLAALAGGVGPGLLAIVVCALGYPLLAAEHAATSGLGAGARVMRLGLFLLVGGAQALGAGALRRAYAESRRERARSERRAERQRRARLRTGEQLEVLRATAGSLAEGLAALDPNGRIVFMNAAGCRLLGWSEEQVVGRPFPEIAHPRRADGAPIPPSECPLLAVLATGRPVDGRDQLFARRDGSSFQVAYSSSPITRGGKVVGAALAFQDVTHRIRSEQAERFLAEASKALTESIDWEATLARVAALAVPFVGDWCLVVVEQEGRPRSVAVASTDPARAAAAREMLARYAIDVRTEHGVGRVLRTGVPELLPEVSTETFVTEAGEAARLRTAILRTLGLSSYLAVPLVARGRTLGAIAFGVASGARRYDEADLAIAQELAARCALAIDNARLYREAQEATRSREEVLQVVSHDLRAPLGAMQLAAQVVTRLVPVDASPELRRSSETVRRATARLARLVDDLVDFARLERGALPIARAPHDAEAIAREALAIAEPVAAEQHVRLTLDAERCGEVSCDRHRILQVLANLIGNAIKVMPGGGAVRVAVRREGADVRFTVSDTGPGIAADDLGHVFDRYWRGKEAGYEGMGLGLAIAKAVVEAHGGRIGVESAPGRGAVFHFSVPVEPPPAGA
jgi:PAS domain S-box-containing protein